MDNKSTGNEYVNLRQSIRALEAEIDEAYSELQHNTVMVGGVGQDSPVAFSYTQSPSTALSADSDDGESSLATNVLNTFVEPFITSRKDEGNIAVPRWQGSLPVGSSDQRKVAFDRRVEGIYTSPCDTMCSQPLYASTPRNTKEKICTPPPSYYSKVDGTCTTGTQSSLVKEPKPVVMPESYDGVTMTFEDWLTNFEICSAINGWSEGQKCSFLAVKLRGSALHVYTDLCAEKRNNYASVVKSLKNRFDRSDQTELFKVQLRARVRKSGENLSELASAIRRLTNRAYPGVPVVVREDLAKDQFIEALDSRHTRLEIRRRKPTSLDEALSMTMEEEMLLSLEEKRICSSTSMTSVQALSHPKVQDAKTASAQAFNNDSVKGHFEHSDRFAELSKKVDDLAKMVESLKMRKFTPRRDIVCWACKQKGHTQANCSYRDNLNDTRTTKSDITVATNAHSPNSSGN